MRWFNHLLLLLALTVPAQAQQATLAGARADAALGFGLALAISDGEALIGEPSNVLGPGAVYVFGQDAGVWTERQRLTASDGTLADEFGWAVDVEDDVLLVGAPSQDGRRGAAYVFRKEAASGQWIEEAKLTGQGSRPGDNTGFSVALRGEYALVGAPFASTRTGRTGAAYVFRYDAALGLWQQETGLLGSPQTAFGYALALADDEALVGAPAQDDWRGAVLVFRRDAASGAWQNHATLTGSDTGANDAFGYSMALHEDALLVGAPEQNGFVGAAYLFVKNPTSGDWEEQQKPLGSGLESGHYYGRSVAMAGEEMWIAAPFADSQAGAVYVFERDEMNGPWTERDRLTSSIAPRFGAFGLGLALDATYGLAGSNGEDFNAGAAYVFERDDASETWTEQARLIGSDAGPEAIVGEAVACAAGNAALFPCGGIDLMAFLPSGELSERGLRPSGLAHRRPSLFLSG